MEDLNPTTIHYAVMSAAYSECDPIAIINRRYEIKRRAAAGDLEAIIYLAHEEALDEHRKREREASLKLRADRRRWRAAYQWAKWGE